MNKAYLQGALQKVKPGLATKEMISQSTSFAFMGDKVVTYNDEISISHPVEGLDLVGAVKAEELYQLLSKIPHEEIEMTVKDTELIISSGRTQAGLVFQHEISLPLEEVEEKGKWKSLPPAFLEALKFVIPAAADSMVKPAFTCVHIRKDGIIETTDGFRVSRFSVDEIGVDSFLLPVSIAKELLAYQVIQVAQGKGWYHFKTEEGTLFSCRIFQDQFPDIDNSGFLNVEGTELHLPVSLSEALDRAQIFSKRDEYLDEEVSVIIKDKKITVEGKSSSGWIKESVNLRYTGDPIAISIHPEFLKDMLSKIQTCTIGKSSVKFQGENWEHVIWMKAGETK